MIMEKKNSAGYKPIEAMTVAASQLLHDGEVVFVGTGLPMLAAILAKNTHAPDLVMVTEAGIYDPNPEHLPMSVSDARWFKGSPWSGGPVELMNFFLQKGRIDVGFLGGAQVDKYGNGNSTVIGDYLHPERRLPGSGGACDIAIQSKRTILIMMHEIRRFVEKVDYITSPGWKCPGYPQQDNLMDRTELGLAGGPDAVVSDMGVMKFDPRSREMYVKFYFSGLGITPEKIQEHTGFTIDISRAEPLPPPEKVLFDILRSKVDPEGLFLGR